MPKYHTDDGFWIIAEDGELIGFAVAHGPNYGQAEYKAKAKKNADLIIDRLNRVVLVFDWAYNDPVTGNQVYARTPERAETLRSQGVKLTPVYTLGWE